jgi:uncharacterized protein (DUF849 family)
LAGKVIITRAITGSIHTPSMSPHLPVTAEQIADSARLWLKRVPRLCTFTLAMPRMAGPTRAPRHLARSSEKLREGSEFVLITTTGGAYCEGLVQGPLFMQTVFGLSGGIGAHSDEVPHMKRTADRLFGEDYVWSVLGAGRGCSSGRMGQHAHLARSFVFRSLVWRRASIGSCGPARSPVQQGRRHQHR